MKRGDLLRWTARRLPGVDAAVRSDLIDSVDQLAAQGRRTDRGLEIVSLIGYVLRTGSRRGARDDRRELIRQGVHVGALVLAVAAALVAWASVTGPAGAIVAALASLVAVAIAGGFGVVALGLAAAYFAVDVAAPAGTNIVSAVVVVAVGVGHRYDARSCPWGAIACAIGVTAGGLVVLALPLPAMSVIVPGMTIAVPIALLLVGWFDPRYAVAGTVVWLGCLATADVQRFGTAACVVIAGAIAIGSIVSTTSIRRCVTL